ncbi:MAG: exo-alpha-sialidase [Acidobacteriia bacterium]|nr:exo-alpha-sialidase [Terriglobia bacterium]
MIKWIALACLGVAAAMGQTSEFVADPMPTVQCHASTVVETAPGELMAAWFGGTGEGQPDVAIWSARRVGGKWLPPVELAREPNVPAWNPVLFRAGGGRLWFYYKFGPSPREWTAARRFSRDGGRTWSAVEHLPAGLYGPIRAKPLVLGGGLIVSGTSVESYRSWAAWIERSTDDGLTWTRHGPMAIPDGGIIQPVVVPMGGKRLRFFARSTVGRVCVSDSNDEGVTWSAPRAIELPNPNAGIDVVRLKDGRFVMVYNHTAKGRTPLNLALSADGERWTMFQALETEAGEYSYPAMVQGSDGNLHITYTWRREKIRHVEWPLGKIPKP